LNCKRIQDEANIMRIDLQPQTIAASDRTVAQNSAASSAFASASSGLAPDQAQLSTSHVQAQSLAAQVTQLPEVRQERIIALRQTVQSGSYRPPAERVAQAILAHMILPSAA